ncbi:MAG: SDR family oxidoreductase [Planctomycetota bacterium]|nr:MAG: SDR family oxidoreductase [Planctomycetota bacterium]
MNRRRFGKRTRCDAVVAGVDLRGKAYAITGANAGIGYETARALASRGARVYLLCRHPLRGSLAAERIRRAHPGAWVEVLSLDLASLRSVRACAKRFPERLLEGLIANAGVFGGSYRETEDGFERTVGVCHFGHFALFLGLWERLRAAERPRLVVVSSGSHRSPPRLDFEHFLRPRERYRPLVAYGQAKLCNVLFAAEAQRRFGAEGLTAVSLHPGPLIATDIGRDAWYARLAIALARPFSRSVVQGAATSVYCATAPEVEEHGGGYFRDCAPCLPSSEARDPEVARRLWELSEDLVARPPVLGAPVARAAPSPPA